MGIHTYFKSLTKLERIERCPGQFKLERHNVASHSFKVTQYAQFLATVEESYGTEINWKDLYEKALNHDFPEVFISDIPTPVKYATPELRSMLRSVEEGMTEKFIESEIPEEYQGYFRNLMKDGKEGSSIESKILSISDKIDLVYEAFLEIQKGNSEPVYIEIYRDALTSIKSFDYLSCVQYFFENILPDMINEDTTSTIDIKKITEEVLMEKTKSS